MPDPVVVLTLLMIVAALVAIETPNLLYSVISVGAVGFLLSIVFLFLAAPDLAITQLAVEVVTLVLLLRAIPNTKREVVADRWSLLSTAVAVAIVTILAAFSVQILDELPTFGEPVIDQFADAPSNTYLREGLESTGAANIVTAVLLDFRAYDTLGEATVLFCAVIGALSILRRKAKKLPEEPDEEEEP